MTVLVIKTVTKRVGISAFVCRSSYRASPPNTSKPALAGQISAGQTSCLLLERQRRHRLWSELVFKQLIVTYSGKKESAMEKIHTAVFCYPLFML